MPFLTGEEVPRHQEAQHKGMPVQASSNSGEVEALKATVAALTDLVKTVVAQAAQPARKPGRPRKPEAAA
jgi:hypothetical protein